MRVQQILDLEDDPQSEGSDHATVRPGEQEVPAPYTKEQFGRRAGLSKSSVDRRIKDGTIRVVRIGRLVRIPASEVDRLLG